MGWDWQFGLLCSLRCSIQCVAGEHLFEVDAVEAVVFVAELAGHRDLALFGQNREASSRPSVRNMPATRSREQRH